MTYLFIAIAVVAVAAIAYKLLKKDTPADSTGVGSTEPAKRAE